MAIKIVTDSSCDLGINFIEENNIELIPLLLNLDGETLKDDLGKSLGYREFYEKLRRYYTMEQYNTDKSAVHDKILKTLQKKFGADYIVDVNIVSSLTQ